MRHLVCPTAGASRRSQPAAAASARAQSRRGSARRAAATSRRRSGRHSTRECSARSLSLRGVKRSERRCRHRAGAPCAWLGARSTAPLCRNPLGTVDLTNFLDGLAFDAGTAWSARATASRCRRNAGSTRQPKRPAPGAVRYSSDFFGVALTEAARRTNTSDDSFVSPATRFEAREAKAT